MVYLLPILAGFIWGASTLFNKRNTNNNIDSIDNSLLYNFASLVISILICFFDKPLFSTNFNSYVYLLIASLLGVGGFISYFKSIDLTDVTLISILNRTSVVITVVVGFVFFSEVITIYQILGIVLIIAGIFSPGIKSLKYIKSKGSLWALLSGIFFGLSNVFDKLSSNYFSSGVYIALGYLLTILILIILKIFVYKTKFEFGNYKKSDMYIAGGLNAIAFFFMILTFSLGGGIAITNVLTQIRLPLILIGGFIFFKEKEIGFIKIISAILIVLGTLILQIK